MDTQVLTPQQIFMLPQQLMVPLFQRPYVWDKDDQWEPLWQDVLRMVTLRQSVGAQQVTHFLGAVVLQASENPSGSLQQRDVIDGQQRLTTLQLLMDAVGSVFEERGLDRFTAQMESLTHNPSQFVPDAALLLKVRHTNRDRAAFQEVMLAEPPVVHADLTHSSSRLVAAHAFFSKQVSAWLDEAPDELKRRAELLAGVLATGLQLVVIDLQASEDSQAIFETLNARGTPLTAADLIKNLVFQRLAQEGSDAQTAYTKIWPFDTTFWEAEVSVGRSTTTQSAMFLNQWLTSVVAEDVRPRATFSRFKHYMEHEAGRSMLEVLTEIREQADLYEQWTRNAADKNRTLNRIEMCVYRMRAIGSEVLKPVLLRLHRPGASLPEDVVAGVINGVESWLVRRTLLRLPSTSHGRAIADVLKAMRSAPADELVARVSGTLRSFKVSSTYWPGDTEIRRSLREERVYRRFSRARLRMFLEAVEDDFRSSYHGQQVVRGVYPVEHLLPQSWEKNWPVEGLEAELDRAAHVHRLGNLTLLTQALNSSASNAPWLGDGGKRTKIGRHDVLLLNRRVLDVSHQGWDEARIDARTDALLDALLRIWPVPAGHTGETTDNRTSAETWISVSDLIAAGLVAPGATLRPRPGAWPDTAATIAADGRLIVDGKPYSPSAAGRLVKGSVTNGWTFWLLDDGRRLADVRALHRKESPTPAEEEVRTVWDPENDVEDARTYWSQIGDYARRVFAVLVEAAPEPVPATVVAERAGFDGVRAVDAALTQSHDTARRFGHAMPSQLIAGNPSSYWMDESTAETFATVIARVREAEAEAADLAPEWSALVTEADGALQPFLRELAVAGELPVPEVGEEIGDGIATLLTWPELRIAVLTPGAGLEERAELRDAGWVVMEGEPSTVVAAVRAATSENVRH